MNKTITNHFLNVVSMMTLLFAIIVVSPAHSGVMVPRTGPESVPCDPKTDFKEIFLVPNWDKLPHKNQEESIERVNEVNSLLSRKKWSFVNSMPVLCCLSFASSTIADWWAIEYGWKLGTYINFYNGKSEIGFNPRELEVAYLHRMKTDYFNYPVIPFPDFVHKRRFPSSNRGYARVLTEQVEGNLSDTIFPNIVYKYSSDKYPFEEEWVRFSRSNKGAQKYSELLRKAMHAHGPLYTHLEYFGLLRSVGPAVHGVVIVGYGTPLASPDKIVFILQDSYGDNPKDYGVRPDGGPSYKYFDSKYLESAIAFPHKPVVKASYKKGQKNDSIILTITNRAKKPLNVNQLLVWDSAREESIEIDIDKEHRYNGPFIINPKLFSYDGLDKIMVYVAADYYMQTPEQGHWITVEVNRDR